MSFQSLERQLTAITQKLEAIHADVNSNKGNGNSSPRGNKGLATFAPMEDAPVGRRRGKEAVMMLDQQPSDGPTKEDIITPTPPSKPMVSSPDTVPRPARGGSANAVSLKDPQSPGSQRRSNAQAGFVTEGELGRSARSPESSINPDKSPQSSSLEKVDKKKSAVDRQARKDFFGRLEYHGAWNTIPKAAGVSCVWLGCAALAVEFVCGTKTTMEMVMNTNHMAVHYVSFPSVTLAELYDTVDEYLGETGLRSKGIKCEVATFDSITMDDVGDEIGMGERLPVMTLAAFRKELARIDPHSVLIFNYDPYVVQEAEVVHQDEDEEEEDGSSPHKRNEPLQWAQKNQGQFAIMLQFNPALHTVSIGTPHLGPDGVFRLEMHTASVQTMYAALCVKDGYTNKSRGFVRVFMDKPGESQVQSIYPLSLLDGRDAGGLLSVALDVAIAPHILGLSMLHHVVQSTLMSDKARRRQSTKSVSDVQLRGIPVTKICHVLQLPVSTIVGGSNKDSVACAFAWYHLFLEKLGVSNDVSVGVVTVTRKGGAEDGAVNISDEQFMRDIGIAVNSKSAMLIGFDVNVALNVVVETRPEPCNFAIVVGFDETHGIVRLADVNVKKYRKLWHVPITRLYNAVIGYGYIIAAKTRETIESFNCQKMVDSILSQGRYRIPADPGFRRFEYPAKNYSISVLGDAVDRLGFPDSNVETFVHNAGFHMSFLLSEHIPLAGVARIASFYSHAKLYDEMNVIKTHFDDRNVQTVDFFKDMVKQAVQRSDAFLLLNFQPATIQKDKKVWNGGAGGPLAIVIRFDEATGLLTLADANASAYYRTWTCPIELMYEGIAQVDRISGRARGTLLLEKKQQTVYDDTRGYDMRRAMVHHPFKPTISTTASVIALAASEMMQKSYSSEQFIYNALEFDLCKFTTRGADVAAVVADANHAFSKLSLQLVAEVVPFSNLAAFKQALCGVEGLLSVAIILYDTEKIHKAKGLGYGAAVANNRGEDGIVKLVDGNPTVFGDFWEAPIHEVFEALLGVITVKGATDDNDMES